MYVLPVRLLVNSMQLVVKTVGSQKLCVEFWLHGDRVGTPTPMLFKGPHNINLPVSVMSKLIFRKNLNNFRDKVIKEYKNQTQA